MVRSISFMQINIIEGARGQVPFERLGDHIMGVKQNFGTLIEFL